MTLPDLEAWAIFAHIADTGSFTAAAESSGVSKATVSKAISRLERSLGVALLHRTSRRLSLTEAGAALSADARAILDAGIQAEAGAGAARTGMVGLIRMTAPLSFGGHIVAPAIADFLAVHPDLAIDLRLHDQRPDFTADRLDLAVASSVDGVIADTLEQRPLASFQPILVAAPAFLACSGNIEFPIDLARRPCLVDPRCGPVWHLTNGGTAHDVAPSAVLSADDDTAILSAARRGLGVARLPADLVRADLASGTLVHLLTDWSCPVVHISLVSTKARLRPKRVTALMDYLSSWLEGRTGADRMTTNE